MLAEQVMNMYRTAPEVWLYYAINSVGGNLWWMEHDLADGRLEESPQVQKSIALLREHVAFAADQTTRFGVETPKTEDGKPTELYFRWFQWWDSHAGVFTPAQEGELFPILDAIGAAIEAGNTEELAELTTRLTAFRPPGDWKESSPATQ